MTLHHLIHEAQRCAATATSAVRELLRQIHRAQLINAIDSHRRAISAADEQLYRLRIEQVEHSRAALALTKRLEEISQ